MRCGRGDRQLAILQSLIAAHHGVLYKTIGDGTQAAFASAEEALRAARGQPTRAPGRGLGRAGTATGADGVACRERPPRMRTGTTWRPR